MTDWLTARGDPCGEFIKVQIERTQPNLAEDAAEQFAARERALLAQHEAEWVGNPFAAPYILDRMRSTVRVDGGMATDAEIESWLREVGRTEGLLLSPEGALTLAALSQLRDAGRIPGGATVVCVNTATGLRYPHLLER